jgi:aspartate-semialdehyde dehydrogenase
MSDRLPVAVLGATGTVGQHFAKLLVRHPWFQLAEVVASDRSAGKRYAEVCRWQLDATLPEEAAQLPILPLHSPLRSRVIFSALPSEVAGPVEEAYARAGHAVFSNAGAHRMDPLVPLLVPEVNPDHTALVRVQQRERGWSGFIVTNPNCAAAVAVLALQPLHQRFGLRRVLITTMQAISGAGYPGLPSLDILDNAIPFIGGEEAKLESEPLKMLGCFTGERIVPAEFRISAHCNRVATRDGHLECLSVELGETPSVAEVTATLRDFRSEPQRLQLPTAPHPPVVVREEQDRPQTRLDRETGGGMAVSVGRIRPCSLLTHKFVAGGSVLNAELMHAQDLLG